MAAAVTATAAATAAAISATDPCGEHEEKSRLKTAGMRFAYPFDTRRYIYYI